MHQGEAAERAVTDAARRTTSRRELSRREHFAEISPELGVLDEQAFDDLLDAEPDAALTLLAELTGATDDALRLRARQLAGRVVVDLAREGARAHRGVGRLRRRRSAAGDVDLDASMEVIVAARRAARPVDADELVVGTWERPDTAVCLLVDRSGSMHGGRLATAALAAAAVVLRAPGTCSVVAFAEDAIVLHPHGGERRAEDVVDDVLRVRGHGVTDLGLALRTARAQLEHAPQGRRLTVLLSDCRATAGGDHLDDAAALDELTILAPAGDDEDARALADALGTTCATFDGPSSVPDALAQALAP